MEFVLTVQCPANAGFSHLGSCQWQEIYNVGRARAQLHKITNCNGTLKMMKIKILAEQVNREKNCGIESRHLARYFDDNLSRDFGMWSRLPILFVCMRLTRMTSSSLLSSSLYERGHSCKLHVGIYRDQEVNWRIQVAIAGKCRLCRFWYVHPFCLFINSPLHHQLSTQLNYGIWYHRH